MRVEPKSTELEPAAQKAPVNATPSGPPPARAPHWNRVWAARAVALGADALQIALLPLVMGGAISPVSDVIDVVTAITLTWLVGWHWAFLPTFLAEIVPFVDLVPTWTVAAWLATRTLRDPPPA